MTTAEMMMTVEMMTAAAKKNSVESGEWRVESKVNDKLCFFAFTHEESEI